ncbi:hypothetical protein EIN_002300 [Entamoeba invadens IP1]|uniref:CCHC-type domain-containing protein n=1 Tax=Entamoeba invadens IP1 TaxID=370355 RepID=L7FJY0_ENTIV|nr:hypothetical protein EIN_002300 [Entamoeba invadens IP1]ELP83569.1 hypothetical protein EIN_002300 [Entamoeba invadens IP1]|eukprot:XP_004182915.1 hypothetical protein EIN_002300 [Entamoeba invadens IP1]
MTKTDPITVRIQPIDRTIADEKIHALFDKYSPVSYDNPRYEKDTPLNYCIITMGDKEAADTLIKEKNGSEWDKVKIKISIERKDPSGSTVNFSFRGLDKSEDDVKKYLKGYKVKSVERGVAKKGTLIGYTVNVVLKDMETANKVKTEFKNNEETKNYGLKFFKQTGSAVERCYICGTLGHSKKNCPEKDPAVPQVLKHKKTKAVSQSEKSVPEDKEQKKNKKGVKREKQNTKE